MIIIHDNGDFSGTNKFQQDIEVQFYKDGVRTFEICEKTIAKDIIIFRDIKKIFNYNCNNFVTFVKGVVLTVILPNVAYECIVVSEDRFRVIKKININIKETLNNLKNGNK